MVQYVQKDVLTNLCAEQTDPNLGTLLVEVVASVLDNEVNITSFYKIIIAQLFDKKRQILEENFLIHFSFIFLLFFVMKFANIKIILQIEYSWPPLPCKSSISMMCNAKKANGFIGPLSAKATLVQNLKQRQWRYIIAPSSTSPSTSTTINNWSLPFSGSVKSL